MSTLMKRYLAIAYGMRSAAILSFVCLTIGLAGCAMTESVGPLRPPPLAQTNDTTGVETRLRQGDQITIRLETTQQPQQFDKVIDEKGMISLPLVGEIKAEGLTPSQLAESIQAQYVPKYYVRCSATVLAAVRFFYVGGEVRSPGRFQWTEDTTLFKAINTAGGFTDYANRNKIEVIREKGKEVYNYEVIRRNPNKDVVIQPGNSIIVPRSIW